MHHLGRCGAGDGEPRAGARCECSFLSAKWPPLLYWGWDLIPSCWSKSPEGWVGLSWLCSFFFFSLPLHTRNFAPEQGSAEVNGARAGSRLMSSMAVQTVSDMFHVQASAVVFLVPLRTSLDCKSTLSLTNDWLFPGSATIHPVLTPHCRTGYACVYSQSIPGCELWWRSGSQRFGLLQMHCLSRCQQYSLPPQPGRASGLDTL